MDASPFEECLHCGAPVEQIEIVGLDPTAGPLPARRVRCVLGHQRLIPDLAVRVQREHVVAVEEDKVVERASRAGTMK